MLFTQVKELHCNSWYSHRRRADARTTITVIPWSLPRDSPLSSQESRLFGKRTIREPSYFNNDIYCLHNYQTTEKFCRQWLRQDSLWQRRARRVLCKYSCEVLLSLLSSLVLASCDISLTAKDQWKSFSSISRDGSLCSHSIKLLIKLIIPCKNLLI